LGNQRQAPLPTGDVVVSNDTFAGVQQAKQDIKHYLETELHLELSDEKTHITHVNEGLPKTKHSHVVIHFSPRLLEGEAWI
jgi:hypothetical protein